MTTPPRSAPRNGLPGDLNATNSADGINQLLGTGACDQVYDGNQIITPNGGNLFTWLPMPNTLDFSQPITMSGTTIGRVQLPLQPVGNGADVTVSLWPDNGSGAPNTSGNPIAAALLPAAYINNVAATSGLENATSPLQTEQNNASGLTGGVQTSPWNAPSADSTGNINESVLANTSDSMLFFGGLNGSLTNEVATCASATVAGTTLALPLPQTSLPVATAYGGATVVQDTVAIYVGGQTPTTTGVTSVWAASWNSGSHQLGTWSAQTALPSGVFRPAVTSWGGTMYVCGGANSSTTAVSSLYFANVSNGQVGAWQTTQLPAAVMDAFAVAVQGWLFVIGGRTALTSTTGLQAVYYAKINPSDGSLGPWLTGPSLPSGEYAFAAGWGIGSTANTIIQICGASDTNGNCASLAVTENGPASAWYAFRWGETGDQTCLPISLSDGQTMVFCPLAYQNKSLTGTLTAMPYVSVPLYASGLTNGATYHVVVQAVTASSASDGVQLGTLDHHALPAVALQSSRHQNSWSSIPSGYSVPLCVWDASVSPNGLARHAVSDVVNGQAQQWMSQFFNSYKLLTGVADVTMQPNVALNSNPTFTTGVSPWTAVNGTITQSSAETHGGYPFSGLLTPTGGFTQAYAASELLPVRQTPYGDAQWVVATGWFWTPTTWSNFSLSVSWFDSSKTYISTSGEAQSLTGATWTSVTNYFQPPATAAYGQLVPTMFGTPAATNLLYMSDVPLTLTPETVPALASIAVLDYAAGPPFPTSVTQLN